MAFDTTKETMVSFLVPSQILETIEDIRSEEGNASRSSIIRKLMNMGLNDYYQNKRNNLVKQQQIEKVWGGKYQSIRWKDTFGFSIYQNQKISRIFFWFKSCTFLG